MFYTDILLKTTPVVQSYDYRLIELNAALI